MSGRKARLNASQQLTSIPPTDIIPEDPAVFICAEPAAARCLRAQGLPSFSHRAASEKRPVCNAHARSAPGDGRALLAHMRWGPVDCRCVAMRPECLATGQRQH
eukprot:CAMPEP_0174331640 /NCGR_PEP_ID=MMETSP0810-20121108/17651_1 /TAXON_ID=73025 ORGANISM="Eutreptiella gymnastica-like, Strain CCMP1594" /NCGR_SAMPLE_ID=MMETSP0810 /ASSEMBLY_ACC=CAM_ASM_000659 /LENGTH=103 /DNA_ID=CAMNT_0015447553 /DNA_START=136 /DNA_END=447 /DNA_ORIENTATION=+